MPRPYHRGQRQVAVDQTRARILEAARDLLTTEEGLSRFSIDAVAQRANVARMTIYYQFASRTGLLEALFDDMAARGGMEHMPAVFQQPDPLTALDAYVTLFGRFYSTHRLLDRRLRGLAVLDPELEQALHARDGRRRTGLGVIVQRITAQYGRPAVAAQDEAVDILHMLTSFESFDTLAGAARSPADVAPLLQRLALATVGFNAELANITPSESPSSGAPSAICPPRCDE